MESSVTTVMTAQPAKFTRYRSVRRAAASKVPDDAPPVPHAAELNRAPSRYRRPSRPTIQTSPPLPNPNTTPSTPTLPQQLRSPILQEHQASEIHAKSPITPATKVTPQRQAQYATHGDIVSGSVRPQRASEDSIGRSKHALSKSASSAARPIAGIHRSYEAAREEARMILEGEFDRLQGGKVMQRHCEQNSRVEVPAHNVRPRASTVNDREPPPPYSAVTRYDPSKFVDAPKQSKVRHVPVSPKRTVVPQPVVRDQAPKPRSADTQVRTAAAFHQPTFDAPVSAVNAGERRVEVRCNKTSSSITLPVTPNTTTRDLLNSASVCMSESFDPRTAILVESFTSVGLERPLRRYEHIRDVINSWDTDSQNYLIIMSDGECAATGLEQKEAPLSQPIDTMIQMTVSHRPGRWDKKWLILRSDGQITASKQENDGEATNICHLSDFDVYTPTRKQIKKIRSPKKSCFAIKSLQKSAMFLEGANFMHFFATNDKRTADRWYQAVHSWRSWYLVNVMGEGTQLKEIQEWNGPIRDPAAQPASSQPQEAIPYQLGSFKPLLEFNNLQLGNSTDWSNSGSGQQIKLSDDLSNGRRSTEQRNSIDIGDGRTWHGSRQARAPPSAFSNQLLTEVRNKVDLGLDTDAQAFTGTGLLARSASRRAQGERGTGHGISGVRGQPLVDLKENSEFADGSLLRQLEAWTASHGEHDAKHKVDRQRRIEADIRVGEGM